MNKFNMFITAVCILILIKLRWLTNKSLYHTLRSWRRIFNNRSRSREIQIKSTSKIFVYCCPSDIDFTKNCIWTNFSPLLITGRKFFVDRTRIKLLLRRLKNIGMVSNHLNLTNVKQIVQSVELSISTHLFFSIGFPGKTEKRTTQASKRNETVHPEARVHP